MKLTAMSQQVYDFVKEKDYVSMGDIANACGRTERSVGANVLDLQKKGLAVREKVEVEGADKPVTYVKLTDEGKSFVPSDED